MFTQVRQPAASGSKPADMVTVPLAQLKVGAVLRAPIFDARDDKGLLLLASGSELTRGQLASLAQRGVTHIRVQRQEAERITDGARAPGALSVSQRASLQQFARQAEAKSLAQQPVAPGWRCERESFLHRVQRPAQPRRDPQLAAQFARIHQEQQQTTAALFSEFAQSGKVQTGQVEEITAEHLREIATDLDQFVQGSLLPVLKDYPSRHALQTAMLATSIGTTMGLRKDQLQELGFGCVLHDAGMLLVPQHLHRYDGPLTTSDRLELQKHPIQVADRLAKCPDVSHASMMVVYQMHERMDGSGYPRQRQGTQIHQFARIAAVADTYLAMVSPRQFRAGLEPYQAVEKLLFAARKGLFDASVLRALLHTVSLFPIGSQVKLSDGRVAEVIRGNREQFARPIVEVIDRRDPTAPRELLDLSQTPEVSVVATAEPPVP